MIVVHIWAGQYGHVSLEIKNPWFTECYISFWPKSDAMSGGHNNVFSDALSMSEMATIGTNAYYAKNYEEDTKLIGQYESKYIPHSAAVEIYNLDERAIIDYWNHLLADKPKYGLFFLNCSTVVSQCLTVGWIAKDLQAQQITQEAVKQKLALLKRQIIVGTEKWTNGRSIFIRPVYRYTRYTIDQPDMRFIVGLGATLSVSAGMLLAAVNRKLGWTVVAASSIVQYFALTFEEISWDPRLAHNIALYLKETVG